MCCVVAFDTSTLKTKLVFVIICPCRLNKFSLPKPSLTIWDTMDPYGVNLESDLNVVDVDLQIWCKIPKQILYGMILILSNTKMASFLKRHIQSTLRKTLQSHRHTQNRRLYVNLTTSTYSSSYLWRLFHSIPLRTHSIRPTSAVCVRTRRALTERKHQSYGMYCIVSICM